MAKSSGAFTCLSRIDCGGETYEMAEAIGTSLAGPLLQATGLSPTYVEISSLYTSDKIRNGLSTAEVAWVTFCANTPEFGYLMRKVLDSSTTAVTTIKMVPQSQAGKSTTATEDMLCRMKANAVFGL